MTANKALIAAVSDDTKASLSSMVLEAGLTDVSVTSGKISVTSALSMIMTWSSWCSPLRGSSVPRLPLI